MSDSVNRERHFCDAIIVVDGVEFHVHKFILWRSSIYFRDLFTCNSAPDKKVFEILDLSAEMMELIIEFAYKRTVSVKEDNVQQLLQVAKQLNITEIVQICCNFLVEKLSIKNCIGIWQFTNICFFAELRQKICHFVINNFEEVVSSEEFQQLSLRELEDILGRDKLNVRQESTVYEAILKWIAHAPEERDRHFAALLSKVRLALTSEEFIQSVSSSALVKSNKECKQMLKLAKQLKRSVISRRPHHICDPLARPRVPNAILLAIGGHNGSGTANIIEVYNIRSNRWNKVIDMQQDHRAYHGTAVYNGSVYCVGGLRGGRFSNSVCRFDLKTRTWHLAAPMHNPRGYVAVTVLNGYIYAIGGIDGDLQLSSVERYRPETNQWSLIASMCDQRSDASCTVLHNKIYVCGGYDGNDSVSTCEYYTPETNQWTRFASINVARRGIGVVAYADQIFAIGGYNFIESLSNVEAYNPQLNAWRTVASMLTPRSNFGIEVIENKLFVVGGLHDFTLYDMCTTTKVEYYDAKTDKWSVASDMGIQRDGLSCCVVSDLPNIEECTLP